MGEVRCGDCKYFDYDPVYREGWCSKRVEVDPDDYCGNWERKEGKNETD